MERSLYDRLKDRLIEYDALPPEARAALLSRLDREEPDVAHELRALLATPTRPELGSGGMTEEMAAALGVHPPAPIPSEGRLIGPYRLVEILGTGGMGVVYRAEQEAPIRREVALKLLRGVFDPGRVVARFEAERQALSRADHPGVARILDAGTDPEGNPYLVMELVHGEPITGYCRKRGLAPALLVPLFVQVCRAVQYAHQKGIVHRDLKPSNVLVYEVDGKPHAKVIDFGIARIVDDSSPQRTLLTREGQVVGTLEYMSPEQAMGRSREIDTRSDVYALGVMLYELVTGERPHDLAHLSFADAVKVIGAEPPRRFRQTSTGKRRAFEELETICLKALAHEPARRYDGAGALADDLERYLRNEPILARPPSTLYQARKLVERHRTAFGVGVAALLLLVGFGAGMTALYAKQRRETAKAEALNAFLQEMLNSPNADGQGGRNVRVLDVLDRALPRLRGRFEGEPEVLAYAQTTLGNLYVSLGEYARAESLFRAAIPERRAGGGDDPRMFWTLQNAGSCAFYLGEYAEAERRGLRALDLARRYPDPIGERTAAAQNQLGVVDFYLGRYAEGDKRLIESIALRQAFAARDTSGWGRLQGSLQARAELNTYWGRITVAESLHREVGRRPAGWRERDNLNMKGLTLRLAGRHAEAESLLAKSLVIRREQWPEGHPRLGRSLHNLAMTAVDHERFDEAERLESTAMAWWRQKVGERYHYFADAYQTLGTIEHARGRYARAESLFLRSIEVRRAAMGPEHPFIADTETRLALLLADSGRLDEAEARARHALSLDLARRGWNASYSAEAMHALGEVLLDRGHPDSARVWLERSLEIERRVNPGSDWVPPSLAALAVCLARQGELASAEATRDRARLALARALPDPPLALRARRRLASLPAAERRPPPEVARAASGPARGRGPRG